MSRLCPLLFASAVALLIAFFVTNHLKNTQVPSPSLQTPVEVARLAPVESIDAVDAVDFREWQTAYQNAPAATQSRMLPGGIASAKARAERMKQLIQSAPAAALQEVLSLAEYVQLPEQLLPYFEKPVSGFGDIDLRWATHVSSAGSEQCSHENRLYINDTSYTLYGAGRRLF